MSIIEPHALVPLLESLLTQSDASAAPAVRHAATMLLREINLRPHVAGAHDAFAKLRGSRDLKIHLGCGPDLRPGWVNIDLKADNIPYQEGNSPLFINHDLREGLPIEEGIAAVIYSSHFFEHLDYELALKLMRDSYRALRPGGRFRMVLPDLPAIFEAYLKRDLQWLSLLEEFLWVPEFETLIDYVNYGVYQHGEHKYIYDSEKVQAILSGIGFQSVTPSQHVEAMDPDNALRRRYSFYTDAIK